MTCTAAVTNLRMKSFIFSLCVVFLIRITFSIIPDKIQADIEFNKSLKVKNARSNGINGVEAALQLRSMVPVSNSSTSCKNTSTRKPRSITFTWVNSKSVFEIGSDQQSKTSPVDLISSNSEQINMNARGNIPTDNEEFLYVTARNTENAYDTKYTEGSHQIEIENLNILHSAEDISLRTTQVQEKATNKNEKKHKFNNVLFTASQFLPAATESAESISVEVNIKNESNNSIDMPSNTVDVNNLRQMINMSKDNNIDETKLANSEYKKDKIALMSFESTTNSEFSLTKYYSDAVLRNSMYKTTSEPESSQNSIVCKVVFNSSPCKTTVVYRDNRTISIGSDVTQSIRKTTSHRLNATKSVKKITISTSNIEESKKRTNVVSIMGNISSNAGFFLTNRELGSRLFFWFIQSETTPQEAPVVVWLQGQPGWSSLYSLFEEHGPYKVIEEEGRVHFELRQSAWTKHFNVLYLDHCIGCGYSIAERKEAYEPTYENVGKNVYEALVQFYTVFQEFQKNDLYLAGEHGGAKYLPVVGHAIHSMNQFRSEKMNLKGLVIGGAFLDAIASTSYSEYLFMVGLLEEKDMALLRKKELYIESLIRSRQYEKAIKWLDHYVYEKFRKAGYEKLYDIRYLKPENQRYMVESYMPKVSQYKPFVQALRVEGLQFQTSSKLIIEEIMRPVDYLLSFLLQYYKVLFYNGQYDMLTPCSSIVNYFFRMTSNITQTFYLNKIRNWYVSNSLRPDGYRKRAGRLTYLVIRNAGHTVGTEKSEILLRMLRKFTST